MQTASLEIPSAVTATAAPALTLPDTPAPEPIEPAPQVAEPDTEAQEADRDAPPVEEEPKLEYFVAPQLSPELQATLATQPRQVRLNLQLAADGTVRSARAAPGVPRRIAVVAERAAAQWRFQALEQAREVQTELVFRAE